MQIEVISSDSDLQRLGPQWNELVAASETDNPFLQWEWCSTWWRHYGDGNELVILLVRDDDQLVGLAPLFIDRGVMKFLGTGEVCSEYLGFVLRRGREEESIHCLLDFLLRDRSLAWRQLRLTHVPADSATARVLARSLRERRRPFRADPGLTSWQIELANSWEEFLGSLGGNLRGKLRRILRDAEKNHLEFHEVASPDEIDASWEDLKRLHQARWQRQGKPGCFASRQFCEFHRELLGVLWQRGMLLLTSLRRNGQALAGSYGLRHRGRVYFYQSGIDPEAGQLRPGHSLRVCELRRAIERGDLVYDFMCGDEDYKTQWANRQTAMRNFTIAGRGLLPRVRFGLESAARWAKESARTRLPADAWASLRHWKKRLTDGKSKVATGSSPQKPIPPAST